MKLRQYQRDAIDSIYDWFRNHKTGNPAIVMPTGSGKSWVIAGFCQDALSQWPETRILMLTHQKELIEQNAEKLRLIWRNAPLGVYSASVGSRVMGEQITFAGIQSVHKKADELGHVDLIFIDECHLLNNAKQGMYRNLISELMAINPDLRIVGLTATPWRLGQGDITEGEESIFSDLLDAVTIEELIHNGHLAPLRSKLTKTQIDTSQVKKRGGEYIEKDLQAAVDQPMVTEQAVSECVNLAGDRRSWLFFCTGVDHAHHVADCIRSHGITAETVTGATPKRQREEILARFKAGEIRALTNANVLTTGFDAPNTDLVALLRPTMSPTLYVQMVGRGMRPKDHTDHCLALDFAGLVTQHGPITSVRSPQAKKSGEGDAPVKDCPECAELVHLSVKACPSCGYEFPPPDPKKYQLNDQDIMGDGSLSMPVNAWKWAEHTSRTSGKNMLKVTYYGNLSDPPITQYFAINHGGVAGQRAMRELMTIAQRASVDLKDVESMDGAVYMLNHGDYPDQVDYERNGKWYNVKRVIYEREEDRRIAQS